MVKPQDMAAVPQAASFGGFSFEYGGDTQAGNTQIYENYNTSTIMSSEKAGQKPQVGSMGTAEDGTGLHTVIEGENGHIDLLSAWDRSHHSQEDIPSLSQISSEDELSQQTSFRVSKISSTTLPPETPAVAGSKRNHRGEVVSSSSTKTPVTNLTTVFGKRDDTLPDMSVSQMFNATQARSSPLPGGPRSDPVFQRPSPNLSYHHSSPIVPTSSPVKHIRSDFSRAVTEPMETYTSMQESQKMREMRRLEKEQEARHQRSSSLDQAGNESDDDVFKELFDPIRREPVVNAKHAAPEEPDGVAAQGSKRRVQSARERRQTSSDDAYITPARPDKKAQDVVELSDDAQLDSDDQDAVSDDEYDELGQNVRSQACYDDGEQDGLAVPMTEIVTKQNNGSGTTNESSPSLRRKGALHVQKVAKENDLQVAGSQQSNGSTSKNDRARACGSTQSGVVADSQPTNHEESAQDSLPSQLMGSEIQSWSLTKEIREMEDISSLPLPPFRTGEQIHSSSEEAIPSSPPTASIVQKTKFLTKHDIEKSTPEDISNHGVRRETVDETVLPDGVGKQRSSSVDPLTGENQNEEFIKHTKVREMTPLASAVPETDPAELPSTPTREANVEAHGSTLIPDTSASRVHGNRAQDTAIASATPSRSTGAYNTAESHVSSPTKTPRSSQRLASFKNSPRSRSTRNLTDIAADYTPPNANTQVNLDEINIMTAEDIEHNNLVDDRSPIRATTRRRLNCTNAAANIQDSPNNTAVNPSAKDSKINLPTPSPSKKREDADITVVAQTNLQDSAQPLITSKVKVTASAGSHTRKSGRAIKATQKLRDQLQTSYQKSSKAINQDTHSSGNLHPRSLRSSVEDAEMAEDPDEQALRQAQKTKGDQSSLSILEIRTDENPEQGIGLVDAMDLDHPRSYSGSNSTASSLLSSPPASPIIEMTEGAHVMAPNRVFALFKGGKAQYWPAIYLGPSISGEGMYQIRFDDGSVDPSLDVRSVKTLELRVGDQVKVDIREMRRETYVVQGFKDKVDPSKADDSVTDVYGFQTVVLTQKNRDSMVGGQVLKEQISVRLENIYFPSTLWHHLRDRQFSPPMPRPSSQHRHRQAASAVVDSGPPTPSRTRRKANPSLGKNETIEANVSRSCSLSPQASGVFDNMAFALTFVDEPAEKDRIAELIQKSGGYILPDGFDELFDTSTVNTGPPGLGTITIKPRYQNLGFTALLADRYSRRRKYIQALALRLPILSSYWAVDTVRSGASQPLPYAPYLLPAGESAYLGYTIRSLVLQSTTTAPSSARLATMLDTERPGGNLLSGKSVLLVSTSASAQSRGRPKSGTSSTVATFAFLIRAMGAGRVQIATATREREDMLRGAWDVVFVEGATSEAMARAACGLEGEDDDDRGTRLVWDELVVQSLILGKLVGRDLIHRLADED